MDKHELHALGQKARTPQGLTPEETDAFKQGLIDKIESVLAGTYVVDQSDEDFLRDHDDSEPTAISLGLI